MRPLAVRWKLTLWYGGILALLVAAFSAAVYWTMRHQLLERIDRGLTEELSDVRSEVERATDDPRLTGWLERRFARHEGFDFQITRPDGTRHFASDRMAGRAMPVPTHPQPARRSRRSPPARRAGCGWCRYRCKARPGR